MSEFREFMAEDIWHLAEDEATEHDGPPEAIDEVGEGPRRIRILLETKDIAVVGNMAALIHSNAKEAIEDLDGSRYMFPETEAAAEALFLFLRNRVK